MDRRTDISSRRTTRVSGVQGQYTADGTLTRRTFCSKRIETVTKVNADGDTIVRNVTRTSSNIHDYMGSFWTVRGETKARRVVTSAGYVDLTTGKRYWYVTNRQGSTMAVVDETGAVVQRNGYYPSGTPYVLPSETDAPSLTAVTDRLHIGNRWLSHSGLNWYDNTARMHDPLLMRFATPDPLAVDFPDISPWSHCVANPANAVDPDGRIVIADEWCQQGILDGLSEYERKYLSFDSNGVMDNQLLSQCSSRSESIISLMELGLNSRNFIMEGVNECILNNVVRDMGTRADGLAGQVLVPGFDKAPSPDNDVHVYTSLLLNPLDRAINIAHEAYCHCYLLCLSENDSSVNPWHVIQYTLVGVEYDDEYGVNSPIYEPVDHNETLVKRIDIVSNEVIQNYNSRQK